MCPACANHAIPLPDHPDITRDLAKTLRCLFKSSELFEKALGLPRAEHGILCKMLQSWFEKWLSDESRNYESILKRIADDSAVNGTDILEKIVFPELSDSELIIYVKNDGNFLIEDFKIFHVGDSATEM